MDGSESRFLRCSRIGFKRNINLSIIGIEMCLREVRFNDIKERPSIKREEKAGILEFAVFNEVSSKFEPRMEWIGFCQRDMI